MSNFWDKFSANVTNVSRQGIQKAKNMSEASSLASEQKSERKNIQEQFSLIGSLYYEKYKDSPDADFAEQIASIIASERRIAELDQEIAAVRAREPELVEVPAYEPPAPAASVPPKKGATSMYCMSCGSTYGLKMKNCSVCGSELVPQFGGAPTVRTAPGSLSPVQDADADKTPEKTAEKPSTLDFLLDDETEKKTSEHTDAPAPKEDAPISPEDKPAGSFCPYCGGESSPEMMFCPKCGKKLRTDEAQ